MTGEAPVRMIATDIDGTMLRDDGTLAPRVRAALHHAAEAGVHVVPATGRPEMVSADVMDALGLRDYWVFGNGSVTRNVGSGELIRGFWMGPEQARALVAEVRGALDGARFAVEMDLAVFFEAGFEKVVTTAPPISPVADVADAIDRPVHKVLVFHDELDIEALFRAVGAVVEGHGVPSYSGLNFIEVAPSLVTKATALAALAEDLGVAASEAVAFGDSHNDVAMLRWAGRGLAMGNANEDAKAAADGVVGTNEDDGLADAIEALLD